MQAETRAKLGCEQQQGLPTKMPLSVCVCVCVRNSRDTGGGRETSRKTSTYVSLKGFRKQQGQRGLIPGMSISLDLEKEK